MGIIKDIAVHEAKKFVKTSAIGLAVDVAGKGIEAAGAVYDGVNKVIDATLGDKETRHNRKEQKYLAKTVENTHLFIKATAVKNQIFNICDDNDTIKYYVKGKLPKGSKKVRLTLLDAEKEPIANVTKAMIALRNPIFHENDPANYRIEINGEEAATLKTKFSYATETYEIIPQNWKVRGNILKWEFGVYDGERQIVHITKRKGYETPTFIIDFDDEEHELLGLMIVLTLICREH